MADRLTENTGTMGLAAAAVGVVVVVGVLLYTFNGPRDTRTTTPAMNAPTQTLPAPITPAPAPITPPPATLPAPAPAPR